MENALPYVHYFGATKEHISLEEGVVGEKLFFASGLVMSASALLANMLVVEETIYCQMAPVVGTNRENKLLVARMCSYSFKKIC